MILAESNFLVEVLSISKSCLTKRNLVQPNPYCLQKKPIMYLCTAKLMSILINTEFLVIIRSFDKLLLALSYPWREHSGILHFFQQQNALADSKGGIPSLLSSGLLLSHIMKTYLPSITFLKVFLLCS